MSGDLLGAWGSAMDSGSGNSQKVVLTGREIPHTLCGYDVSIHPSTASSPDTRNPGSNKVKITTVTNQNWELPTGRGTIVASNEQFLAYVLEGKSGHVLRLIQPETGNRALLKGFVGAVVDVSFAHAHSNYLACVDQGGNVYVWDLDLVHELPKAQSDALCVVVQRHYEVEECPHRLVWSPYVLQDGEDDSLCIVATHGTVVEVIELQTVLATVTTGMKITRKSLEKGILTIDNAHYKSVCDVSLSPDGQVLATCGEDGHLKFWGVAWDCEAKCLHDFSPHEGEAVTRLIFCDDHTSQDPTNQFWRFLLTACNNNAVVKLWCTVSWKCLQTIRFCSPQSGPEPHILMNLDLSASYLVVTDSKRVAVYVLQLNADSATGTASLTSLTEYLLTQPIFSFIVPGHAPLPRASVGGDSSDSDGEAISTPSFDSRRTTVGIKLHTIHSKSMQELEIRFEPPDVHGVPPQDPDAGNSSPDVGLIMSHDEHTLSHDELAQPSSLPPRLGSDTGGELTSDLFHSLVEIGSPKLLTPSQFKSTKDALLPSPSDFSTATTTDSSIMATPTKDQPLLITPIKDHSQPSLTSVTETLSLLNDVGDKDQYHEVPFNSGLDDGVFLSNRTDGAGSLPTYPPTDGAGSLPTYPPTDGAGSLPTYPPTDGAGSLPTYPPTDGAGSLPTYPPTDRAGSLPTYPPTDGAGSLPTYPPTDGASSLPTYPPTDGAGSLPTYPPPDGAGSLPTYPPTDGAGSLPTYPPTDGAGSLPVFEGTSEKEIDMTTKEVNESNAVVVEKRLSNNAVEKELSEDSDDEISPEEAQQAMDNIFETLHLDPPSIDQNKPTFEEFTRQLADPLQPFISTEKNVPERSEFVSLPPRSKEQLTGSESGGTERVNASTAVTPAENLASLRKITSEQPDREGVWPEPETTAAIALSPNLMANNVASSSEVTPVIDEELTMPSLSGEHPAISEGLKMPSTGEEPPTISEELLASSTNGGPPMISEELVLPSAIEGPPVTSEGLTMPSASVVTPLELMMPSVNNEDVPVISDVPPPLETTVNAPQMAASSETPKLLLAVKLHDVSHDTQSDKDLLAVESHDISHDTQLDKELSLVGSGDQLSQQGGVKGRGKRRGRKKKKNKGLVVAMDTTELNSQSDGDYEEGSATGDTDMASLYQLVARQQQEIRQLREEHGQGLLVIQGQLEEMKTCLMDAQSRELEVQSREQQQRLDRVLKERSSLDKQRQDKLISTISTTLSTAVKTKMDHLVRNEMKNLVIPSVTRSMATIQNELSAIVAQRVTATDTVVREGIAQILQTRGLSEVIGGAVASSLQRVIMTRYEEAFKATVLPGFEKACQEMFRQIDDAFRRGTTEYIGQLSQHNRQLADSTLQQVSASIHSLVAGGQGSPLHTQLQACLRQEMATVVQHLQRVLTESLSTTVAKEIESAFEEHSKMSPEARLREDKKLKEDYTRRLIAEEKYNQAFEVALSTSDLKFVMFLCQQLNPDDVFDKTPCPLSQPVLLSLIQQLSVDLQDQLELKIRYLEQSILSLDVSSDVTKSHMTPVISHLSQQLSLLEQTFQSNPSSATPSLTKLVKRLRMMAQHMCQPTSGH